MHLLSLPEQGRGQRVLQGEREGQVLPLYSVCLLSALPKHPAWAQLKAWPGDRQQRSQTPRLPSVMASRRVDTATEGWPGPCEQTQQM